MPDFRYIRRQISRSRHQSLVFILCVALSMVTLVSLGSFSRSVHSSLLRDARTLHAADIIIRSRAPFPADFEAAVTALEKENAVESARVYEFYSVVRKVAEDDSLLAQLKVVEQGYPFYGQVKLASGRPFHEVLTSGSIIVEQVLLDRLHLQVGDRLKVGEAILTIADVVVSEPDRPVNFFALGPRLFVAAADLEALDLVGKGSRVSYYILAKVHDQRRLANIAKELRGFPSEERIRVETYRTANSRVKRFFDNLLFFLNLIGIFTLLLAGIGIQSTLAALLKEKEKTIAIMKTLGARSFYIISHYFGVALLLGLIGTLVGLVVSLALQNFLPSLFRGFLPADIGLGVSPVAVGEGLFIGFMVVVLFTALPLFGLRDVKPKAIFGKEEQRASRHGSTWLVGGACAMFFLIMVLLRIRELKTGLYFVLGTGILILAAFFCTTWILRQLQKRDEDPLIFRQAMKGLFRARNSTRAIIVTLAAALTVVFSITLVEKNLDASFIQSFPADAPNLFFIDIQSQQKDDFLKTLGIPATTYAVVRAPLVAINGERIDPEKERGKRGDNLGRTFNLTYRKFLLDDERIVAGKGLFRPDWKEPQVSVLERVLEMRDMKIGDLLTFRVQGIEVSARISSIRARTEKGLKPFFYFVFSKGVLEDAPQTFFTAVRLDKERIAPLQNHIVARFPNVSVIDLTEAVTVFSRIMAKLSTIIRFFTLFSIVAGFLIIISSVFATRHARIQETVYFKILGAKKRFVLAVFSIESLLLGLISALLALIFSQVGSWIICWQAFDLTYRPFIGTSLLLVMATALLVLSVGVGASLPILTHKPAAFLREQSDE
ncbi:MAG: ABC transporter permease [Deltaproteobacteria bacterium]|nr:ABC transporter permease [Deltaproteobacteria bacterium]